MDQRDSLQKLFNTKDAEAKDLLSIINDVEENISSNLAAWEIDRTTMTQLVVPEGVTKIGSNAFYMCQKLKSLTIPESVESIGDGAFLECRCLTSLNIGKGVESIGNGAFSFCTSLKSLVIPEGVESIGFNAFHNCNKLTSLIIPKSVTAIGHEAFMYCPKKCDIQIAKTKMQVLTMGFYPWGIKNGAVIHCIDGDLIVGKLAVNRTEQFNY